MIIAIGSGTTGGTMNGQNRAPLCRVSPLPYSEPGIPGRQNFTHNAGVAGSSPAPAITNKPATMRDRLVLHSGINSSGFLPQHVDDQREQQPDDA